MMKRRRFMLAFGACLAGHAAWVHAQMSAGSPRRIGVLAPSTHAKEEVTLLPFFEEMRRLGWIEGQTVAYDRAYADDQQTVLPRLAAELVARRPELIYAPPQSAAVAARQATQTIPIVFATGTNPVGSGLVSSLARPGGNATGVISVIDSLAPKLVELMGEVLPNAKRLGLPGDPTDPRATVDRLALAPVAAARGLTIIVGEASSPLELDAAVARLLGQQVDVIFTSTTITFNLRGRLMELTNQRRVPVIGHRAQLADAGALLAYSAPLADQLRRSAHLVDKVLKGAKPADIPVEQPTRFELVVNLKAARELGIRIPHSVLLRAERVIE